MNSDKTGKEYATKDISNIIGIAPPTVRKYSQALEKAGYSFIKNEKGFRIFIDEDIFVFNELKSISNDKTMSVQKIAEMIVFNQRQEAQHKTTSDTLKIMQSASENSNDIVQYDARYNELLEKLSKLDILDDIAKELQEVKEMNKALMKQTKQQQEFIEKLLLERDQKLVGSLRTSMENKQLQNQLDEIKESLSEVAAGQEKIKQSFFSRLFSPTK